MIGKIIVLLAVALAVSPAAAYAQEFSIPDKQIEIRIAHIAWIAEGTRTGMEAAISYINEIGGDTAKLSALLEDFNNKAGSVSGLETHVGLNNIIKDIRTITTDFRVELAQQRDANNGQLLPLLSRISDAKNGNAEMASLEDAYWESRKTNELAIFDIRVERAQTVLDNRAGAGYDITEAQAKLEEIKAKRPELEEALADRDHIQITAVTKEIFELSAELARIVKELQVELTDEQKVGFWIRAGKRAAERISAVISDLESLGNDVSALNELLSSLNGNLDKAMQALDAGDIEAAKAALSDARADFVEIVKELKAITFQGQTGKIVTRAELTADAVEDLANEIAGV